MLESNQQRQRSTFHTLSQCLHYTRKEINNDRLTLVYVSVLSDVVFEGLCSVCAVSHCDMIALAIRTEYIVFFVMCNLKKARPVFCGS